MNGSAEPGRDTQAREDQETEQTDDGDAADETEFLADDGEDEVVVRVGKVVPLGATLPEAVSEHPAVGERVQGLPRLVADALRIAARGSARSGCAPIDNRPSWRGRRRRARARRRTDAEDLHRQAGEPQQRHQDDAERDRRTEVRLQHDQHEQHERGRDQRDQQVLQSPLVRRGARRAGARPTPRTCTLASSDGCRPTPPTTNHRRVP